MKQIEIMGINENVDWCKPYISDDCRFAIAVCEGKIAGMILNGDDVAPAEINDRMREFAAAVNPSYDLYSGWSDLTIALDGDIRECGCVACPWREICDAVNENVDSEKDGDE